MVKRAFRTSHKALLLEFSSRLRIANARELFQGKRGTTLAAKKGATSARKCSAYPSYETPSTPVMIEWKRLDTCAFFNMIAKPGNTHKIAFESGKIDERATTKIIYVAAVGYVGCWHTHVLAE